ncbi:DNA helicase/exodeoxyribonuclease V, alpha subunit [Cnuella takakiae]|uniref:RecBCD enzyme subunit RecD n=1 Tax=Cnuella takakiae TaxID=1302690 RepID=A0A1M5J5E4_9BACT|nr:exodeoxyribonuclease V subunit alpha [Cnuella takakiae]OLY91448.1 exodeoxyribonuclease V subunit alpha [Cnuella takakiae]SHG35430.1 DNA helicase/exodeoxyribonuclease V, alpha subunit [Cnuella takakiae]
MQTLDDVHFQFAAFFQNKALEPYVYLLSKKLAEGHICLQVTELDKELSTDPLLAGYSFAGAKEVLQQQALVACTAGERQPFVLHQDRLYLHRYFQYETRILRRIEAFLEKEDAELNNRIALLQQQKDLIAQLFDTPNAPAVPDWQLAAAITGVLHNFTIITGGPGTGKTTTVAKILALLFATNPQLKVALAAPTGKAAARMAESLKNAQLPVGEEISARFQLLTPSTIHRLLQNKAHSPYFKHDGDNPLPFDVVIVDESSMIDVALFAKLLSAIGPDTRLILLGDKDQLASVEAGSLFGDLCQAQALEGDGAANRFDAHRLQLINAFVATNERQLPPSCLATSQHPLFQHVVELQYSHRFSGDAGIGKLSKAVIQGNTEVLQQILNQNTDEEVVLDAAYDAALFEQFIWGYQAFIREGDTRKALKLLNNLRVLCALREGPQGVAETNRRIEQLLQRKRLIDRRGEQFYEHRPVMLSRNYYNLGLFNGDTGILRKDPRDGSLRVFFEKPDGDLVGVAPGLVPDCETAFAMTIHKSQGSEFTEVLVLMPQGKDLPILTRELLYTGITRARKKVLVQGAPESLVHAASRSVERGSGIINRLAAFSDLPSLEEM